MIIINKIICLIGNSGSGKSLIESTLKSKYNLSNVISTTTRLKRDYEEYGVHYNFISNEEFDIMNNNNCFVESTEYPAGSSIGGLVKYGLEKKELDNKLSNSHCVFVVNPDGYKQMLNTYDNNRIIGIYVKTDDSTRIIKTLQRYGDKANNYLPEICRRYLSDIEYFSDDILKRCITVENDYNIETIDLICEQIYNML